jgi:RNA polymerase sigma-70 factor (ECF subfamily)
MAPDDLSAAFSTACAKDPGAREAFDRFTCRLIALARSRLDEQLQHKIDAEDVVQSAYKSFILRYGDDRLGENHLDDLWSLLSLITLRKCADRVRGMRAACRDVRRDAAPARQASDVWHEAVDREPSPDEAAVLAETVQSMLAELTPAERPIIELSLQGYSTRDVCDRLGRAERSVRRVRERVRRRLESQ